MSRFPRVTLDVAWESDPLADSPIWADESARLRAGRLATGRQQELDVFQPGTANLLLDNSDRGIDPLHLDGPNVDLYLYAPSTAGNDASTPDHATLDIIGDLDVRARVDMEPGEPAAGVILASKWLAAGNQRSWVFIAYSETLQPDGLRLMLAWSADGTNIVTSPISTAVVPSEGPIHVRATLDVDNGAAGNTVTFYTSPDGITWAALGTSVVTAGVTSIFSGTAALAVGRAETTFAFTPLAARIFSAEVRAGIAGSIVANPDFAAQPRGTTSFADSTGKTWTVNSSGVFPSVIAASTRVLPRKRMRLRAYPDPNFLSLPGVDSARATCPDAAGLDLTGDLSLRACIRMTDWTPTADFGIAAVLGKWDLVNSAYGLFVLTGGQVYLSWINAGGATLSATSTMVTEFTNGTTHWIRGDLDVDNGAAGRTITFYTSDDPPDTDPGAVAWTALGALVVQAGITTVRSDASLGFIGAIGTVEEWAGRFYVGEIRDAASAVVASPDFRNVTPGATTHTDGQGNVWTVQPTATVAEDIYELYTGFADRWPQTYAGIAYTDNTVTATDLFALLANISTPRGVYEWEVLRDKPRGLWPLDEGSGTATDRSGRAPGTYRTGQSGTIEINGAVWPASTFIEQDPYERGGVLVPDVWPTLATDFALSMVAQLDMTDPNAAAEIRIGNGTYGLGVFLGLIGTGLFAKGTSTVHGLADRTKTIDVSVAHHLVYFRTATQHVLYIDGVDSGVVASSGATLETMPLGMTISDSEATPFTIRGTVGFVVLWDFSTISLLNAGRIAAHWTALAGLAGQRTGERADWVLDRADVPASMRDIDTGNTILGPAILEGVSTLEYLRRLEITEYGALYVDHQNGGRLRFRDRYQPFTDPRSTAVQAVFSDQDTAGVYHYERDDLLIEPGDEQLIYNEINVQWASGTYTVVDEPSRRRHGPRSVSLDTLINSQADARNLAEYVLLRYREPVTRVRSLTLNPAADTRLWPVALGSRIGDRVTVRLHPQQVGTPIEFPCLVEGIDHDFAKGVNQWSTTLHLSPAGTETLWQWDLSTWDQSTVWAF